MHGLAIGGGPARRRARRAAAATTSRPPLPPCPATPTRVASTTPGWRVRRRGTMFPAAAARRWRGTRCGRTLQRGAEPVRPSDHAPRRLTALVVAFLLATCGSPGTDTPDGQQI